jgi:hypothetical protein
MDSGKLRDKKALPPFLLPSLPSSRNRCLQKETRQLIQHLECQSRVAASQLPYKNEFMSGMNVLEVFAVLWLIKCIFKNAGFYRLKRALKLRK